MVDIKRNKGTVSHNIKRGGLTNEKLTGTSIELQGDNLKEN